MACRRCKKRKKDHKRVRVISVDIVLSCDENAPDEVHEGDNNEAIDRVYRGRVDFNAARVAPALFQIREAAGSVGPW